MLGVYAIHHSIDHGWSDSITVGAIAASVVLLAVFILIESKTAAPLMHLALFRVRSVSVANVLALIAFGTIFAQFFLLALFMQQVLGYSALKTGFAYLPLGVASSAAAALASVLVTKLGPRPIAVIGMTANAVVFFLYTQAPADASYLTHLLPAFILAGVGLGFSAVSVQIAAFSGVSEEESGLAAGLINTAQEIGGATMIAIAATIAISGTKNYIASHAADIANPALPGLAFTDGMHTAFTVLAILTAATALLALVGLPGFATPPPPNAHHTTRPLHAKPIHQHVTEAQREHVARHGHFRSRNRPSAASVETAAAAATPAPAHRRPSTAAAPAKKAPTARNAAPKKAAPKKAAPKKAAPKKAAPKKAAAKKATTKKATPAKKAAKRRPPRST